jgi:hypothetical protein
VKAKPRHVHVGNRSGGVESREYVTQFDHMLSHHPTRVILFVEPLELFVANRADQSKP